MAATLTRHPVHDITATTDHVVVQEEIVRSSALRKILAVARIIIGFTFMWPFLDKLFGLGFATPSARAWINGGNPSQGFLKGVTGPFADFFHPMASSFSDWLFMAGLFGIGLAMLLGAGLKVAAWGGALLLTFMYLAEFPWGQPADFHATNPIVDSHWHEAALLLVAAYSLSGDTWGLGKWWSRKVGNSWLR